MTDDHTDPIPAPAPADPPPAPAPPAQPIIIVEPAPEPQFKDKYIGNLRRGGTSASQAAKSAKSQRGKWNFTEKPTRQLKEARRKTMKDVLSAALDAGDVDRAMNQMKRVWDEGVLVGRRLGPDGQYHEVHVPVNDIRLRFDALNEWMTRLLGRPTQPIELPDGASAVNIFIQQQINALDPKTIGALNNATRRILGEPADQATTAQAEDAGQRLPAGDMDLPDDRDHRPQDGT